MANRLERPAPPALPLATETYDRPFMDQNSNVLRLFFTRLVNAFDNLVSTETGGKFLHFPYGVFYSTVDQTAANPNTGYAVTFNTTRASSAVTVASNSRITVSNDGVYHVKTTLQLESTNSSSKIVSIWLAVNGTAQINSAHEYVISGSGNKDIANWNSSLALSANDYIEIFWATDDVNVTLNASAASSPRPAVTSASVAVTFVSNT